MAHDFFIDSLGFHKAISPERPYERATAPFRKEQFDTSPTVGDQSLTGWWTRGQFSFHMGAGVKYYEVLDGETVLNRFTNSDNVTMFEEPGELTLDWEVQEVHEFAANVSGYVNDETYGWFWLGDGTIERLDMSDPSAPYVSASASLSGGGIPVGVTGEEGGDVYVATTANKIERFTGGSLVGQVVYTHSTGIINLWVAKGRLWVLDDVKDMYAVALVPGTIPTALSSPVVSFPEAYTPAAGFGSLAETPGDVYFGSNQSIWRIGVDADGTVPTLAAPVRAAVVPSGVSSMSYSLGHLVISGGGDLRVALVRDDGSLVLGPVICDASSSEHMDTGQGVLFRDSPNEVRELDLRTPIGDGLIYPWRTVHLLPASLGGGVRRVPNRPEWLAWQQKKLYSNWTEWLYRHPSGYVTTGWHRLGTLDSKHFHEVLVRTAGEGTVTVERVDADANFTSTTLGTFNAADGGATFSFGLDGPVERIALRFHLHRKTGEQWDEFYGPTLLGYQIRALPAPARQRLIRVPLQLFDRETGATGRASGRDGQAWERLAALEALEASDSLVSFEDKDTGETGTAFIETVEVTRTSPTSSRDPGNGFGGFVSVTLRKVS